MCVNGRGERCPIHESVDLRSFVRIMEEFNLAGAFALFCEAEGQSIGMPRKKVLERVSGSALFLNVMGFIRDAEILDRAPNRAFLDIDPGFGQMWQELGLRRMFTGHHHYVTIGENIRQPECTIPTCGLKWITI